MPEIILRRRTVETRTGLGRSTLYQKMAQGEFPRPLRLGPRSVGWRQSDIDAWIAALAPTGTQEGGRGGQFHNTGSRSGADRRRAEGRQHRDKGRIPDNGQLKRPGPNALAHDGEGHG
jgi:prophage regulatory protein